MSCLNTLQGLGLVGDQYGPAAMDGLFSDIVGGIFGGGSKSKEKTIVQPAKGGGGGKISPLTVGLIAGGALLGGALLVGTFKRK